jgi:prophage regulatory protein
MKVIRANELAEILSVSVPTIWRMEKRGDLPHKRKIGQRIVGWLKSDIDEWLNSRPIISDNNQLIE